MPQYLSSSSLLKSGNLIPCIIIHRFTNDRVLENINVIDKESCKSKHELPPWFSQTVSTCFIYMDKSSYMIIAINLFFFLQYVINIPYSIMQDSSATSNIEWVGKDFVLFSSLRS